jgi:hypothetical protein
MALLENKAMAIVVAFFNGFAVKKVTTRLS